jgi:hypothetical protein
VSFGAEIDYAQRQKIYGPTPDAERRYSPPECIGCETRVVEGNPDPRHISSSATTDDAHAHAKVHATDRRFTRLTFSKKVENHAHAVAISR